MKRKYYIVQKGEQLGPFTFESLMHIKYSPDTLVWTEGLNDWLNVTSMEDFLVKTGAARQTQNDANITELIYSKKELKNTFSEIDILKDVQLAGYFMRFFGVFIHWIILIVLFTVLPDDGHYSLISIFFIPIISLFTYQYRSGNPGHLLLGLKVVDAATGNDFNHPLKGAVREFIKSFFSCFFIPVIWLLWDKKRQNIYDKMFNTIVIQINKEPRYKKYQT